ncbi:MAG: hypothetical protein FI707_02540 [SAR202 cluster bacterium]|jgi:rhamnogalacturonyl hydrolase YesR|nr:hypothetical protein [Chloroflexota bacterium]MDP6421639.1 glycoside hydrolase family 88 protein [SAR202 cluster bacterium]HAL46387.1 hypothetical protein [Dehalococcoidia bacterium]MDP6664711.1 glycoside hydrolase family 88 protein [SAR202 cluster bacterium]MDP6800590.1 glycoside hydrolase family 88 protein [SAR202 cluster bacterium]|tara:strand:- start:2249 stop:3934 length:1686 start_codon:yes stop_codon:yes gene_type:complete
MRVSTFDLEAALSSLAEQEPGRWLRDACGVTRSETLIPALVDRDAYSPDCARHRILLIGGFSGEQVDVDLTLRAATLIGSSSEIALTVVPCANPDGLRLGVGPDNGVGGDPAVGYPPEGGYFDDERDPEARYLWRWVSFMAPDVVVEVLQGAETGWESTHPAFDLGRSLNAGSLGPSDSMLAALAVGEPSGLAPIAGLRLTATEGSLEKQIAALLAEFAKRQHTSPSPAREELDARRSRNPLDVAKRLASQYGYSLDPVVYTQGVAISGRLRVAELTGTLDETAADIAATMEPLIEANSEIVAAGAGGPALAGLVWCDELSQATGDTRYADALIATADRFRDVSGDQPPAPCDPDYRTEDMFFAAAILGRAFELTGDIAYIDILTEFLLDAKVQQANGLFWHARSVPYFWGRGNTFAALGYTEALSYVPEDHPDRAELLVIHVRHLDSLAACLRPSGMLMEALDVPGSYQEHTATAMFGYAVARGLRRGWLDDRHRSFLDLAWRGVTERTALDGGLVDGCTSTGPQPDLRAYLDRKAEFGRDERTGALALWFAVEMERLQR